MTNIIYLGVNAIMFCPGKVLLAKIDTVKARCQYTVFINQTTLFSQWSVLATDMFF